jgi:hypothetical protein
MSETCSSPTPVNRRRVELAVATQQGEPSGRLPRTADGYVATASVARASKLAKAASAQDRTRLPASWASSPASTAACPSSEGLRNTHPAIRYPTPTPYAVEQVVSYEHLGFRYDGKPPQGPRANGEPAAGPSASSSKLASAPNRRDSFSASGEPDSESLSR